MQTSTKQLLEDVRDGKISVNEALLSIKTKPFEDLGYAKVDLHREARQGVPEVIYGEGKTAQQIAGIARSMNENSQQHILITRLSAEKAAEVAALLEMPVHELSPHVQPGKGEKAADKDFVPNSLNYDSQSRIGVIGTPPENTGIGTILIATAGTSDVPVAEEAALTAQMLGNNVERAYDMGVSGLHRTLSGLDAIMSASVIVAVAGMEGALASLLGGLADCPVIAVPTSVGYGASFGGVAALLAMLNSCASGVSVVNIDNGFGAGYIASQINHMG